MKFIEVSNEDKDKLVSLDKYIEELKYFYDIYSKGDTEDEMVEELIMYECLISWLEELKHYREKRKKSKNTRMHNMSLDKAIEHNKEHRKKYHGAKACDKSCRNHGSDDWAKDNRLYRANRLEEKAKQDMKE